MQKGAHCYALLPCSALLPVTCSPARAAAASMPMPEVAPVTSAVFPLRSIGRPKVDRSRSMRGVDDGGDAGDAVLTEMRAQKEWSTGPLTAPLPGPSTTAPLSSRPLEPLRR